jgi:hypothetical protein
MKACMLTRAGLVAFYDPYDLHEVCLANIFTKHESLSQWKSFTEV